MEFRISRVCVFRTSVTFGMIYGILGFVSGLLVGIAYEDFWSASIYAGIGAISCGGVGFIYLGVASLTYNWVAKRRGGFVFVLEEAPVQKDGGG